MQNKFIYALLISSILGCASMAWAQEEGGEEPAEETVAVVETAPSEVEEITPNLDGRQPVDFPARSSMGSMELAPLPRLDESQIEAPAPMTPSVSSKDFPSEQLLGRLNPDVFQQMADIDRTKTLLDLQAKKIGSETALEKAKSEYRTTRLNEIKAREDLIHQRIQWWQEQEKIRLDNEKLRAEEESMKSALDKAEEQKQLEMLQNADRTPPPAPVVATTDESKPAPASDQEVPAMGKISAYTLLSVQGTNSNLTAKVRNVESKKVTIARVGDTLATGDVITSITPTQVVMAFEGTEYILTFDDGQ
ncbi:MAG: hypothetical protein J6Y85_05710 [Alphaproteobacteria bacterium]|nr:hypothetical protein [Alphaproteobacteria bacterium]